MSLDIVLVDVALRAALEQGDWLGFRTALNALDALESARLEFKTALRDPTCVDQESLGACFHELGCFYVDSDEPSLGLNWFLRAADAGAEGDNDNEIHWMDVATSLEEAASCLTDLGRTVEALETLERMLRCLELAAVEPAGRVQVMIACGDCLVNLKRWQDAYGYFVAATEVSEDTVTLGTAMHQAGYCAFKGERVAEARVWFEGAVTARRRGDEPKALARSMQSLAVCCGLQGDILAARDWRLQARLADPS